MIKSAIMVAASDHPQNKRDMIAQTLFSCDLIKCTGDGNPPQRILDDKSVSESVVLGSLKRLLNIRVSLKTLEATGIGRSVRVLQKHGSKDVRQIAWALVKKWKGVVDEYIKEFEYRKKD
ncbi:hypothetical protein L1987_64959 [Smallanthus sonchifolius]|uniref:Uncharacterized protein n=1 Tax=Smallanthus sonchifolius TaxID=185202 RepID=A0ACB9BT14_9ASTR|nr:hypothetical protein L1987_64959 [Smallanthus sonchifolius]